MNRRGRTALCAALAVVALAWTPARSQTEPAEADPWNGKPRSEIVKLLGEPDRTKAGRDGCETITYTLYRIGADAPPHPAALLVHLPGVGLVARVDKPHDAGSMTVEPPVYDEQGRPAGGGLGTTHSASSSYDPKTGTLTRTSSEGDNPQVTRKVKVRFVLDPSGRVVDWSAPGKNKQ